jgi:hypothetical protein
MMENQDWIELPSVSERMITAAQNYLATCGAIEETSLVFSEAFAEHMLETMFEESEEPYDRIDEDAQARSVEYFAQRLDPENPAAMTERDFVEGLLTYALLGIDVPTPEEG